MKKFVEKLKNDGYCLKDGVRYGKKKLPTVLRSDRSLTVSKEKAKNFRYAKKCLVNL